MPEVIKGATAEQQLAGGDQAGLQQLAAARARRWGHR
jgi:hypothetical protein